MDTHPGLTFDADVAVNSTGGLAYTNTVFSGTIGWFGPTFHIAE